MIRNQKWIHWLQIRIFAKPMRSQHQNIFYFLFRNDNTALPFSFHTLPRNWVLRVCETQLIEIKSFWRKKRTHFNKEWGNFGFVPYQFLKLVCQFCFSNNGQAAYNSEFILTLGFNSILWSFYNSQWLKKETYTKFCKKWLKRNIAKNGSHDIVKL